MTLDEARDIRILAIMPEINSFVKIQDELWKLERSGQSERSLTASLDTIRIHAGIIVGMDRVRFVTLLEEAKKVIEQKMKKETDEQSLEQSI